MNYNKIIKTLLLLSTILLLVILSFFAIKIYKAKEETRKNKTKISLEQKQTSQEIISLASVINKKNNNQALSPAEEQVLNTEIEKKIIIKTEEIKNEAKNRPYNSTEIDFLLNPKKNAQKALGIIK